MIVQVTNRLPKYICVQPVNRDARIERQSTDPWSRISPSCHHRVPHRLYPSQPHRRSTNRKSWLQQITPPRVCLQMMIETVRSSFGFVCLGDPRTRPILIGQETLIEIDRGQSGLGLSVVGGSDTQLVRMPSSPRGYRRTLLLSSRLWLFTISTMVVPHNVMVDCKSGIKYSRYRSESRCQCESETVLP